jgi:hypothetical protein
MFDTSPPGSTDTSAVGCPYQATALLIATAAIVVHTIPSA